MPIEEKSVQQYTFNDEGQLTGEPVDAFYDNPVYKYVFNLVKERSVYSDEKEQREITEFIFDEMLSTFGGKVDESSPDVVFETFIEDEEGQREWEEEVLNPIVVSINNEISSAGEWEDEDYIKDTYEYLAFEDIRHSAEYDQDVLEDVKKMGGTESDLSSFLEDKKDELEVDFKTHDHYASSDGDIVLYSGNLGEEEYELPDEIKDVLDNLDEDERDYVDKHIEEYIGSYGTYTVDRSDISFSFTVKWTDDLKEEFEEYLFDNQKIEEIPEE